MTNENRSPCDLVINNARVFDGEKLRDGLFSVGITGGKISFVDTAPARALKEIDAAGKFLMPGLIDCHLHLLNMWTAVDEASMAADISGDLTNRLNALLRAGVTTVKSVGDSEDDVPARARDARPRRTEWSSTVCHRRGIRGSRQPSRDDGFRQESLDAASCDI